MATLSVSVDQETKDKMNQFDEVNWSAVARKAFQEKIKQIELLKKIMKKSKLSASDAKELGMTINKRMAKRFLEM